MTPQEAYKAALEAAAKEAERLSDCIAFYTINDCAKAIRALPVPQDAGDMVLVPIPDIKTKIDDP